MEYVVVISQNEHLAAVEFLPPSVNHMSGIDALTWKTVEEAVLERLEAVELFLADVAGKFRILNRLDSIGAIGNAILNAREHLSTAVPSFQRRIWLAAVDLTCDSNGQMWFVDDHYCCPFGLRTFGSMVAESQNKTLSANMEHFATAAKSSLQQFRNSDSTAVVLGSSTFNTTYRENRFFADFLGLPYMNQRQLEMQRTGLYQTSVGSDQKVSLVIRRLQDDDLDPNCFRAESLQGVRGLVRGARRGLVTVLNAPGTGLFNSRKVSRLIPQMIRFYLGKEPALPTVPTIDAGNKTDFLAATRNMSDFIFRTDNSMDVLKPLVAESATRTQKLGYLQKVKAAPENFVVRRTLKSICGDNTESKFSFRTFCVGTSDRTVLRGGIQRASHADGTPTGPITQDSTAFPVGIE